MAYNLILSLIPAFIFIFSLFGLLGKQPLFLSIAMGLIDRFGPPYATFLLQKALFAIVKGSSGQLTFFGLAGTLWSATGWASTLIKGLNRAYEINMPQRLFWYSPTLSVVLMLALSIVALLVSNLLVFGDAVIQIITHYYQLPIILLLGIHLIRWSIIWVGGIFFSSFIYALILRPKYHHLDWSHALIGGIVFMGLWIVISLGFSFYVSKLSRFNPIYGPLGAVVLLITWFYLSSLAVLIGGEVVAMSSKQRTR